MQEDDKAKRETEKTSDFIPNQVAPDNWPHFGERCNPLCSKGESETSRDYFDYEDQYNDYLDSAKEDNYFYDE